MGDYERSTTVNAARDDLFEYLSTLDNLPQYMDSLTSARHVQGREIEVTAEVDGKPVAGDAWFSIDADRRALSWGSEGPNDYKGELQVTGDDSTSEVIVRLHTVHDVPAEKIEGGMDETLANVKELVEGRRA